MTSPVETVETCRFKSRTYERLRDAVRCPTSVEKESLQTALAYPVFIKLDCGEGSKGCHIIRAPEDLKVLASEDHIVLEYLPGDS